MDPETTVVVADHSKDFMILARTILIKYSTVTNGGTNG